MNYTDWCAKNRIFEKDQMWIKDNLVLETIMGSHAYGCQTPDSDFDHLGIFMPKREYFQPFNFGFIPGFDILPSFDRLTLKGGKNKNIIDNKEHEGEWISIIKFFHECGIKSSPNLLEVLFVKRNLVSVGTKIGWKLRDNRKTFLSLKTFKAFSGYANGQMKHIRSRKVESDERRALIEKYNFDIKMAYHTLRLLDQLEQLLTIGDLDLMRNRKECQLMRMGQWGNFDRFEKEYQKRMDHVAELARKSPLSPTPMHEKLHNLLMECLEDYYGDLGKAQKETFEFISSKDVFDKLTKIENLIRK